MSSCKQKRHRGIRRGGRSGEADSVVAQAILAHVEAATESWSGTATELLQVLGREVEESVLKSKGWPRSTRRLGNRLRRLAPGLRMVGVHVEFIREAHTRRRLIVVGKDRGDDVPNVPAETETRREQASLIGVEDVSGDDVPSEGGQ